MENTYIQSLNVLNIHNNTKKKRNGHFGLWCNVTGICDLWDMNNVVQHLHYSLSIRQVKGYQ